MSRSTDHPLLPANTKTGSREEFEGWHLEACWPLGGDLVSCPGEESASASDTVGLPLLFLSTVFGVCDQSSPVGFWLFALADAFGY